MKKKVLHITKYYKPIIEDDSILPEFFIDALKQTKNNEQQILTYGYDNKIVKENIDGLPILRIGGSFTLFGERLSYDYSYELDHILKMFEPDTVFLYYPNYYAAKHLLKLIPASTKLVLVLQKRENSRFLFFRKLIDRSIISRADVILLMSKDSNYKLNNQNEKKVSVLEVGYKKSGSRSLDKVEKIKSSIGKKHLIYSNLFLNKKPQIKIMLKTLRSLGNNYILYVLVNNKQFEKIEKLINNRFKDIKEQIKVINYQYYKEDLNYISAASIYLDIEKREKNYVGYSNLRVIAAGIPMVSFVSGVNKNKESGLVSLENSKDLAINIKKICGDSLEHYNFSLSTETYFNDVYSFDDFLNQIINLNL